MSTNNIIVNEIRIPATVESRKEVTLRGKQTHVKESFVWLACVARERLKQWLIQQQSEQIASRALSEFSRRKRRQR